MQGGGKKNKKPEGGVCDRQKGCQKICYDECYDICFLNFYHKHPLMQKNASKVWKKDSANISAIFLDAAGWSNTWFNSSLSFSMSCIGF